MAVELDRETIARLRTLEPGRALSTAKDALYGTGSVGSDDFIELYEQLVREGVVTWDEVDAFEGSPQHR